jgi:ribokinase
MGSINIDLVMFMKQFPSPGETILTDNFQTFPGGKGGNQAVTAARLGGTVTYFTKLGNDGFSQELISKQKEASVNIDPILIEEGATAGIAMIWVDESGQNSISFTPGANRLLTPADVQTNAHVFDQADILLITMEIQTETVYEAIRLAKSKGLTVVLDPAPAPAGGIPNEIAALVDYTKPNETEAEILTGIKVDDEASAKLALDALKAKGFQTPIVSLGSEGAVTYVDQGFYRIEPIPVESIDTTAAGDVFIGAFTAALSMGESFTACLDYAKTAAAISTTRKGAQSSIPNREEVLSLI